MKIIRSTKCTTQYATQNKQEQLSLFLTEYVRIVNKFIDLFWGNPDIAENKHLVKSTLSGCGQTWLSERAKQCAARQALAKCKSTKASFATWRENGDTDKTTCKKPRIRKLKACLSSQCAVLEKAKKQGVFNCWLRLSSLGNKLGLRIPIKLHKHYYKLLKKGRQCTSFEISEDTVKISFEMETGKKLEPTGAIGLDTGINALASISTGEQIGTEVKARIERIKRCKHGSKGQQRARTALRQYLDLACKQIMLIQGLTLLVVEKLKNITKNTKDPKRRLGKDIRRSIGAWNVRYFHGRLEQQCEWNRVSFRTVPAYYTSQTCPACGCRRKGNRDGLLFKCPHCGYADNADISASKTILNRFLDGKYADGAAGLPDRRNADDMSILLEGLFRQQNNGTTTRKPRRFRNRQSSAGVLKSRKRNIVPVSKR